MGILSGVADIFGGVQQKRAAAEAVAMLREAQNKGYNLSASMGAQAQPFLNKARSALDASAGYDTMLQDFIKQTQAMDTGTGLSAADQIALKDAQRLMNENLVGTGNLRSGAAAFANVDLARRAAADASQRSFERTLNKMQLLFGGQAQGSGQALNRAQIAGGVGTGLNSISANLMAQAMGLASPMGQAEMSKGAAIASTIGAVGGVGDSLMSMGMGGAIGAANPGMVGASSAGAGGAAGAMMGGNNMAQLMMLQKLFAAPVAP